MLHRPVAVGLAAVSLLAARQTPSFRASVDTVAVYATVRERDGRLAAGLRASDFELFDNGRRRDIAVFSSDVQPITVAILIDRSSSVRDQADKVATAIEAFAGDLLPGDRVALNSLTWDCMPLTPDTGELSLILRTPMQGDIGTPLWAGLDRTIGALESEAGRRAVLLFSDGYDNPALQEGYLAAGGLRSGPFLWEGPCWLARGGPGHGTRRDVSARIALDSPIIYAVSVQSEEGTVNDRSLQSITRDSGGRLYTLKDDRGLADAFRRIADELHHQYLFGFVPTVFDGKLHTIELRAKRRGLTIQARQTFVADRAGPIRHPSHP